MSTRNSKARAFLQKRGAHTVKTVSKGVRIRLYLSFAYQFADCNTLDSLQLICSKDRPIETNGPKLVMSIRFNGSEICPVHKNSICQIY